MKPFFKWSGGKYKEIKYIKKYIPKDFQIYYEPFLGAGALLFYLMPKRAIANDSYFENINFFNVLKNQTQELCDKINNISNEYNFLVKKCASKEEQKKVANKFYYFYRDNNFDNNFDNALKFYILRQLSFCGMLRFNKNGKYNVPYGWYKNLKKIDENIFLLKNFLSRVKFECSDWKENLKNVSHDDFIFLDPPYTTKFQKYHPDGNFDLKKHEELADWFCQKKGKALIVINKDEFTFSLYKDFIKEEYGKNYSIQYRNRIKKGDNSSIHLLATNF